MASNKERAAARDAGDAESSLANEITDDVPRDRLGRKRGRQRERADPVVIERRIEWVRKAIIDGFPTSDIVASIQADANFGGISRRQIFRYIERALDEVRKLSKHDHRLELGKAIARNELIIRRSLNPPKNDKGKPLFDVDLRTAVRANQANARLMGLEAPIRHRHGGDPDSPPIEGGDFIVLVQEVTEG